KQNCRTGCPRVTNYSRSIWRSDWRCRATSGMSPPHTRWCPTPQAPLHSCSSPDPVPTNYSRSICLSHCLRYNPLLCTHPPPTRPPRAPWLLDTSRALTMSLMPQPNPVQLLPFHLALCLAVHPPSIVNTPPAYTSLADTATAYTLLFIPEPSAVQLLPFHLAVR